ncbi:diguanylate cyclase/phosphodiesterase (GGDEF & EAL domains) with PAS/PAC sensor(s) (plasmid) [Sinorhizobium sojae CCBAU 05684]|uniref:Diguanylate cyclase/phosphodiesterase (GGDEF & EAL domains) with PAS/PAC sensor(S) n=1 Tax=Sinorhizobium sojae CCBAU 05684 TaxID=716928 RepID=A0A249PL78_9HYPH|nr:EAL domain-containing protein [Sinorhizobium sojae]ASY66690.1 diguanylate cyclase/phosphodiesterase (GGDEF & EAL domains) with PAS/PAC sensor(s) [Sinorhizobium sojae CCBAU 05684]
MLRRTEPRAKPLQSVERYIRSIGRHYVHAVIVMTMLIGATYLTVVVALDRHSLQQNIGFLTSNQFIRFQQLANQTRALMRASADPNLPDYIIRPMRDDILRAIGEVRAMSRQLAELHDEIGRNFLEKLNPRDDISEQLRLELDARLEDFLARAERIANAGAKERRERYSFWGPIDFAVSSDSVLMRQFGDLIRRAHERSGISIDNAKLIGTALLALIAATVILASIFLFSPLLKKLRNEHRRTMDFEERLTQLAHTDALTGLANRSSFNQALGNLFSDLERTGTGFAMLLVDLDRFKSINDSLGHPAGDAVLDHVARVLQRTLRSTDIAARLGGDEFAVLLPGMADSALLATIADRAVKAIAAEIPFEGRVLQATASIGGAVVPSHANDEASLMRVVDLALYTAKSGRNTAVIFDEAALARRLEQNQLSLALVLAADRDEFVVHYQPKVDLATGMHLGFEALVRWQHPELGLLPPGRFLPLMEGTQLIRGMTRAVIATVGRDLDAWKRAGLVPGTISINLPEVLLVNEEGYNLFVETILANRLEWHDFAVEITEDVFLNRSADQILDTVARFREHGLSVSLDDFGTGFASLVHLRDFPFDELKIDRSFVTGIGSDARSEQIIRAMVDLSRNLGKRCVAEGIETDAQRRFLLEVGCEVGQGYLFGKPEPVDQAGERLPRQSGGVKRLAAVGSGRRAVDGAL